EQYVVTGSDNGEIIIWNILSGNCVRTLKCDDGPISCIKFIESCDTNENKIVSCSRSNSGNIRIWDFNTGKCEHILHFDFTGFFCRSSDEIKYTYKSISNLIIYKSQKNNKNRIIGYNSDFLCVWEYDELVCNWNRTYSMGFKCTGFKILRFFSKHYQLGDLSKF